MHGCSRARKTAALVSALAAAGCSSAPSGPGETGTALGPTFHKDIEPILQRSCLSCHSSGNIAPFALTTYEEAKAVSALIALQTREGSMPPWGAVATDACQPRFGWQHDHRLEEDEIALIEAWDLRGAPEGDPGDAPAPVPPAEDGLPGVELSLAPSVPFVAMGEADQFRCFVLDPRVTGVPGQDFRYMNGTHFIAGNPAVVHHALVFLDPDGEAASLVDEDGGYDCFGGPGISNASLIAAWAPGGVPTEFPPNVGLPIGVNQKLVMQIHYHPAGATAAPDATTLQMRFSPSRPEYLLSVSLIGNFRRQDPDGDGLLPGPNDPGGTPTFLIPPDTSGHTETMRFTVPAGPGGEPLGDVRIYGVSTHMHYVGTDMQIGIERSVENNGDPRSECLIGTPRWDFNWQRAYMYDAPIAALPQAHTGDVLSFRCTYDNTMDNPFVARALKEQRLSATQAISLGETTLDEMCLGAFFSIVPFN